MSDICAPPLNDIWNKEIITQKSFPKNLKLMDVTSVFKKEDTSLSKKYRPVSLLPVVFKIYEKIKQKQILEYIHNHLSPYLRYSTQTALISILEKWKLSIDNKDFVGGVLINLSKAFDTINTSYQLYQLYQLWIQQTGFSYNM